jgi:hypothetical protein
VRRIGGREENFIAPTKKKKKKKREIGLISRSASQNVDGNLDINVDRLPFLNSVSTLQRYCKERERERERSLFDVYLTFSNFN